MAKQRTSGVSGSRDELIDALYEQLNKDNIPVYRIGEEAAPSDLKDFISSGASVLDVAVSNKPSAGIISFGRSIELQGMEQSGKSLVCAHMITDVQKDGGIAVLIDSEFAVPEDYFRAVGVDFSRLQVVHSVCLEDVFDAIEKIITKIRQNSKDRKVLIIIDSLTALKPRDELEGKMEKEGYGTKKAIFLSSNLPRIHSLIGNQKIALVWTQQLRQKMNAVSFGDQYTTSGGKAPGFYASVRIRFSKVSEIKKEEFGENVTVGVRVQAHITKNRLGPPQRKVQFDIYFDRGIDDVSSWIVELKKRGIITGTAAKFVFKDDQGVEHTFKSREWKQFTQQHPATFQQIYERLVESMVTTYQSTGVSAADGTAVTEDVTEQD